MRHLMVVCFTLAQLQSSNCRLYCRMSNYDSGVYQNKRCWCADKMAADVLKDKRLNIPAAPKIEASYYETSFPEHRPDIVLPWE